MSRQLASYRRSQVEGATPEQLLVLLFQAAVQRGRTAAQACTADKDPERGVAVRKLLDIVIELRSTLDKDAGGEIATNLDSLYEYVITTVIEAHASRNSARFEEATQVLDVLRDAFTQAAKQVEPEALKDARRERDEARALEKADQQPAPTGTPGQAPPKAATGQTPPSPDNVRPLIKASKIEAVKPQNNRAARRYASYG